MHGDLRGFCAWALRRFVDGTGQWQRRLIKVLLCVCRWCACDVRVLDGRRRREFGQRALWPWLRLETWYVRRT